MADRLTNLKDDLRWSILGKLHITDAVKTSLLSRSWQNTFENTPCFNFPLSLPGLRGKTYVDCLVEAGFCIKGILDNTRICKISIDISSHDLERVKDALIGFLDWPNIRYYHLQFLCLRENPIQIPDDMHYASFNDLVGLTLNSGCVLDVSDDRIAFPSLKRLDLSNMDVIVPRYVDTVEGKDANALEKIFPNVVDLRLRNVTDKAACAKIISMCRFLQSLEVESNTLDSINAVGSSLTLKTVRLNLCSVRNRRCVIFIPPSCENLVLNDWFFSKEMDIPITNSLEHVVLKHESLEYNVKWTRKASISSLIYSASKFFNAFKNVKALYLSNFVSNNLNVEAFTFPHFEHLKKLEVEMCCCNYSVLSSLLSKTPALSELYVYNISGGLNHLATAVECDQFEGWDGFVNPASYHLEYIRFYGEFKFHVSIDVSVIEKILMQFEELDCFEIFIPHDSTNVVRIQESILNFKRASGGVRIVFPNTEYTANLCPNFIWTKYYKIPNVASNAKLKPELGIQEGPLGIREKIFPVASSDGKLFSVEGAAVLMSTVFTHAAEELDESSEILVPVRGAILSFIVDYCKYYTKKNRCAELLQSFEADFIAQLDLDALFHVMEAADFLGIQRLVEVTTGRVADIISGKDTAEVRRTFNIRNDYTTEAEEKLRDLHSWAFC